MVRRHLIVILACCALLLPACLCSVVMPELVQRQSQVADAEQALSQVQLVVSIVDMPPEVRARLTEELARARAALRMANQAVSEAAQACATTRLEDAWGPFIQAWKAIRLILGTFGVGSVQRSTFDAINDPVVVQMF
jgi:aminopeptidase N